MEVVNVFLTLLLVLVTAIYTYITYKILQSYRNPVLFIHVSLVDVKHEWDKWLMRDLDPVPEEIRGLSKIVINKKIKFKIKNNGASPAYDILLKYEIQVFKNEIEFGIDEADVKDIKPFPYKKSVREIRYDYLPPNGEIDLDVVFTSNFPKIQIFVTRFRSKEVESIKRRTLIFEYQNIYYCEVGDSLDYLNMIGA